MDIQVSSNFERLLFEAGGRDAAAVRRMMTGLVQSGAFTVEEPLLSAIRRDFFAGRADEAEVAAEIGITWREAGYLLDPHTAVGMVAARRALKEDAVTPMVVLSTAHPAKFPDAVQAASGVRPPLPPHLADLYERPERFDVVANDIAAVEAYVRARARAARGAAA